MNDGLILGLAVVGGIAAFYSFAVVAPLILGAIGGAVGCGIVGVIIGLVFLTESVAEVTVGCVALGTIGGLFGALEKSLTVPDDIYIDDPLREKWGKLSRMCSGITLLIAGLIGAFIAGSTGGVGALEVFAGYGAGTIVGSIGWFLFGNTLVYQLLNAWYMHKLEEAEKELERELQREPK